MALRGAFFLMSAVLLFGAAASPSSAASAITSASPGLHAQSTLGDAALPEPAQCSEHHHPCGPRAISVAYSAPPFISSAQGAGTAAPRAPALLRPPLAPHAAASLSILFRNFRE